MRMKGNPENALHIIFLLFSVCRGEIYKSLLHILTNFKKRFAMPYDNTYQKECQQQAPAKISYKMTFI